jgi:hypothetical protein
MANTSSTLDRSNLMLSSVATANAEPRRALRCRYDRITLGFWLGGIILGTAGCLLGAAPPYHHPVARVISVLWWGIYFGCSGACLGALPGLFLERILLPVSQQPENAGTPGNQTHRVGHARPTEWADDPAVVAVSTTLGTGGDSSSRKEPRSFVELG